MERLTVHIIGATHKTSDGPLETGVTAVGLTHTHTHTYKRLANSVMGKVIPELNGNLPGLAFPLLTLSILVTDLTCCLEKAARYKIMKVMRQASDPELHRGLTYLL
ncbi:Glyceraldehyde-3-phosphate dehydrogenase [Fukomys damarensis]|uniref:glyceraldehyde-3-phosphate dehydrogenase (phosphorylating) n=1 Tax=Fukomys damarensis TaxID=885580 RepID=A0A091DCR5_FUKDA|nr:Glyceraldehyde-3-phosphate dehydrogenase [Fukomys damarensis]